MDNEAGLIGAATLAAANTARYPNESAAYRAARNALLAEEIELRRHLERVAAQRRALPPGGEVTAGYRFMGENGPASLADAFSRDFRATDAEGKSDYPGVNVFTRRDGVIRHFYSGEMSGEMADPGQDPRGAPDLSPLWNVLDMTPNGRQPDWYPKLSY